MGSPIDISVEIRSAEVQRLLRGYEARGKKPPLNFIGGVGLRSVDKKFRDGGTAEKPWAPLQESTIRGRKHGGDQPLRDTSKLWKSFDANILPGLNVRIAANAVTEDGFPYALPLHFGVRTMPGKSVSRPWFIPPRPMAKWENEDMKLIINALAHHLHGEKIPPLPPRRKS